MPNNQLPGFKAVHPQLAIEILHSRVARWPVFYC